MDALALMSNIAEKCAHGIDMSSYQWFRYDSGPLKYHPIVSDPVDFKKMAEMNVKFAFVRATTILGEPDYAFELNWKGLKDAGIARGAYGFPNQKKPVEFAQRMYDIVAATGDLGELPPAMDYERLTMTFNATEAFLRQLGILFNKLPLIYSNWNSWFKTTPGWINTYEKWVANWVAGDNPSKMPVGWKSWTFWQYSVPTIGYPNSYGVKSKELDHNMFNGTWEQMCAKYYINIAKPPTLQEQINLLSKQYADLEKRVTALEG